MLDELYQQYDEIIAKGYEENPPPPPAPDGKQPGRPKKGIRPLTCRSP